MEGDSMAAHTSSVGVYEGRYDRVTNFWQKNVFPNNDGAL